MKFLIPIRQEGSLGADTFPRGHKLILKCKRILWWNILKTLKSCSVGQEIDREILKMTSAAASKGKTCGFWRLLMCPWWIEEISLVWKWQNVAFWSIYPLCWWLRRRIKARITCTRERTISSAWLLCFFNTTGFVGDNNKWSLICFLLSLWWRLRSGFWWEKLQWLWHWAGPLSPA